MNDAPAQIGHNRPPPPLDPTALLDWIEPDLEPLRRRRAALLEAVERFRKVIPITDDEAQGNAAEFDRQLRAFLTSAEELRKEAGRPYLECTKSLNAVFKTVEDGIGRGRDVVNQAMTGYAQLKRAEEQRRRDAAAAAARQAAELATAQARAARGLEGEAAWDRAVNAAERAGKAERQAGAGSADLSRVRGDQGAVVSLPERWTYEVIDLALVPEAYVKRVLDGPAVNGAIATGTREIPGLRIFDAGKVQVR